MSRELGNETVLRVVLGGSRMHKCHAHAGSVRGPLKSKEHGVQAYTAYAHEANVHLETEYEQRCLHRGNNVLFTP